MNSQPSAEIKDFKGRKLDFSSTSLGSTKAEGTEIDAESQTRFRDNVEAFIVDDEVSTLNSLMNR